MQPRIPVERVDVSAYAVPTDAPEGDGTFAWDQTLLGAVRAEVPVYGSGGFTTYDEALRRR